MPMLPGYGRGGSPAGPFGPIIRGGITWPGPKLPYCWDPISAWKSFGAGGMGLSGNGAEPGRSGAAANGARGGGGRLSGLPTLSPGALGVGIASGGGSLVRVFTFSGLTGSAELDTNDGGPAPWPMTGPFRGDWRNPCAGDKARSDVGEL
jgi:hypothetical protein